MMAIGAGLALLLSPVHKATEETKAPAAKDAEPANVGDEAAKDEAAKDNEETVKNANVKNDDVAGEGGEKEAYEDGQTSATPPTPKWKGPADYSGIDISKFKIEPGKDFTPAQKQKIYEANMKHNDGLLRSDLDGAVLEMPQKSKSGVTPSLNEAQVDHVKAKSQGGTNDPSENAQVLSRKQNRDKWDK